MSFGGAGAGSVVLWILVSLGIVLMAAVLPAVVGLLLPGRKGILRASRQADWRGMSIEEARNRLVERLAREQLVVDADSDPLVLRARREPSPQALTHAQQPLAVDMVLEPHPEGLWIRAEVRMTVPVVLETGEGRYLEAVLDRIVCADQVSGEAPPIANLSYLAQVAAAFGVLVCLLAAGLAVIRPGFPSARLYFFTLGNSAFVGVMLAVSAWSQVKKARPGELTGRGLAAVGVLLCLAGVALGLAVLHHLYPDQMPDWDILRIFGL